MVNTIWDVCVEVGKTHVVVMGRVWSNSLDTMVRRPQG